MQVLKEVRLSAKGNFVSRMLFEKHFTETYKPIVVLANPKTYINYKYAKREIKEQIIRADQLIAYIKRQDAESAAMSTQMEEKVIRQSVPVAPIQEKKTFPSNDGREETMRKLKAFRLAQSRQEKIKPYYIFNDAQMADLIEKLPQTKEELLKISGFGNVKVEKYGDKILEILHP